jgi:hypothetical protein
MSVESIEWDDEDPPAPRTPGRFRRFVVALVATVLIGLGLSACDTGPDCKRWATMYTFGSKGQMSTTLYCAEWEQPTAKPRG